MVQTGTALSSIYHFEYIKNKSSGVWTPYKTNGNLPITMLMGESEAWCDFHSRVETVFWDKEGRIHFDCGKAFYSPAILQNTSSISSIVFKVDIKNYKLDVSFRTCKPFFAHAKKNLEKRTLTSHFDLNSGKVSIEHHVNNQIYFDDNFDIKSIPSTIQNAIQNSLTQLSTRIFGFPCKNTFINCQEGFKRFVLFPACPPISCLPDCFIRKINRKSKHPFEDLCALHKIKPAKSFRKKFTDNPAVFVINIFLKELGFTDSNVFNKYYENAALIYKVLKNFTCTYYTAPEYTFYNSTDTFYGMQIFVKESLKKTSETVVAKRLLEPLLSGQTDEADYIDCATLYYKNSTNLPESLKKRLLKEGFTLQIHNRICEALNQNTRTISRYYDSTNTEVKYNEIELQLEQRLERKFSDEEVEAFRNSGIILKEDKEHNVIQKLYFELPKSVDDLYMISDKMKNCVGYLYRERVLSKQSYIITVEDMNMHKGVACIEIINNTVVQALGPCNARIKKEYIRSIQFWMQLHHLKNNVSDLSSERNLYI